MQYLKLILLTLSFATVLPTLSAQKNTTRKPITIPLYASGIPNAKNIPDGEIKTYSMEVDSLSSNVSRPTLTIYFPTDKATDRAAVIVCPGGGYHTLLTVREGSRPAQEFNRYGAVGIVLKYRHPNDANLIDKSIAPLQDAQRAIQVVREHASEWGIDPQKIGIMGYSAGGHVAATAGTHYRTPMIENRKKTSLRPDFMILVNPVISCRSAITHAGSRDFLIGNNADEQQIHFFSNEEQVTSDTPPTFLNHANDDTVVPVENSLSFYNACRKHNVPVELHTYVKGEHGFLQEPLFEEWFASCIHWMKRSGWLKNDIPVKEQRSTEIKE